MPDFRLIDISALPRYMAIPKDGGGYMPVVPNVCLAEAPKVDAVPVVRCKDCNYAVHFSSDIGDDFSDEYLVCKFGRGTTLHGFSVVKPESYCDEGFPGDIDDAAD